MTHEQFFSEHGIAWPPDTSHLSRFLERKGEVVVAADKTWPETEPNVWKWFDTLMTLERSFQYPLLPGKQIRSPWSEW